MNAVLQRAGFPGAWVFALVALFAAVPSVAVGQDEVSLSGVVIDVDTGQGVGDAVLRIVGTDVTAATDSEGRFVVRGVQPGSWVLRVSHLAYGTHDHDIAVAADVDVQLEVRLAQEAIELAPLVVEGETSIQRERRTTGSTFREITLEEIQESIGTTRHLGELISRNVPGMSLRQSNQFPGVDVCLEFRSAASISLVNNRPCSHPTVVVDGVRVSAPNYLYGSIGLQNLRRIQVIPPSEAGTRYGTGSLYGVVLIETARPGLPRGPEADTGEIRPLRGPLTFDWDQDPAGHSTGWALVGAALGNAVGLAAGLAIARQCISVVDEEIESTCSSSTSVAAGTAAFVLPAVGSAFGARVGGGTELSVGSPLPAAIGAAIMLFPGYTFSMSTVGGDQAVVNRMGHSFLVLGVPLAVTLADRLFRELR